MQFTIKCCIVFTLNVETAVKHNHDEVAVCFETTISKRLCTCIIPL